MAKTGLCIVKFEGEGEGEDEDGVDELIRKRLEINDLIDEDLVFDRLLSYPLGTFPVSLICLLVVVVVSLLNLVSLSRPRTSSSCQLVYKLKIFEGALWDPDLVACLHHH